MSFFKELKRRNVIRMGLLYIVASWVLLQIADVLFDPLGLPEWAFRLVLGLLMLGFPLALIFAWVFEMTPEGLKRERDVDRSRSIVQHTGRKMNVVIVQKTRYDYLSILLWVLVLVSHQIQFDPLLLLILIEFNSVVYLKSRSLVEG